MTQAEELRKISEQNYRKLEVEVNDTLADIYKKALRSANKGYESIKYTVTDSMIFFMIAKKLRAEGYKIETRPGDRHTLILNWGRDFNDDEM